MHGYNSTVFSVNVTLTLCVQCLCVSPTYELALQTGKVIEQMGKFYPEVQLVYAIRGNKCKLFYFRSKDFLHNSLVTQYLEYVDYYVFLTFRFLIDPMMLPSKGKLHIYYTGVACNCASNRVLFGLVERGTRLQEQIVIGTPGTVLDWCQKLKFIDPKMIKVFVLDEADVMIATQGHQDQSIRIQRYRISLIVC